MGMTRRLLLAAVAAGPSVAFADPAPRPEIERRAVLGAKVATISYRAPGAGRRPVIFFFPGGPGSAASGLVIGGFGPLVVDYPAARLVPNRDSLLRLADLVFVDMPGIGFSRPASAKLEGVEPDAALQAAVVLDWLRTRDRLADPVYLAGKSYGVIRAAFTALKLSREAPALDLRGLVLLSGAWDVAAMDFPGGFTPAGDLSAFWTYLPTYAAVARHYDRVPPIDGVRAFATDRYAPALLKGDRLPAPEVREIAARLCLYTGLPTELIARHRLRISSELFRRSLVPGRVLGLDNALFSEADDPHEFGGDKALDTAWDEHLRSIGANELGPYARASIALAARWDWAIGEAFRLGYPRAANALVPLLAASPKLKLFVAHGEYDLSAPFFMAETAVASLGASARATQRLYPSGHTLWVDPAVRGRLQRDIGAWLVA